MEETSLTRQIYLAGAGAADASPEAEMWRVAKHERAPDLLQLYLKHYPNGEHAADVKALLAAHGGADGRACGGQRRFGRESRGASRSNLSEPAPAEYYLRAISPTAPTPARPRSASGNSRSNNPPPRSRASYATSSRRIRTTRPPARPASISRRSRATRRRRSRPASRRARPSPKVAALSGAAGARPLRRRPLRRGGQVLPRRGRCRRRARAGEPRTVGGERRPRAQGRRRRLCALPEGRRSRQRRRRDQCRRRADGGQGADQGRHARLCVVEDGGAVGLGASRRSISARSPTTASPAVPPMRSALYRFAAEHGDRNGHRAAAVLLDEGRHAAKNPGSRGRGSAARRWLPIPAAPSAELTATAQAWAPATVSAVQRRLKDAGYYAGRD